MAKKQEKQEAEVDEHGLVVQKYASTVLVVVPPEAFDETTLRYARSALFNVHVGSQVVSTDDSGFIRGELQDELQPDARLDEATMDLYSGVLFCGGAGTHGLAEDRHALRLVKEAAEQNKLIGAWAESVLLLARAGIVRRRRVTGAPSLAEEIRRAGGRYTGRQVEVDGNLVTALDDAAGFRFGKALVQVVAL